MKDLSKMLVVKELINSLHLIKKNAFWLVIASLTDAVFLLAYGFFTTPVSEKIVEHSVLVANKLSEVMAGKFPTGVLFKLFGPELRPLTFKLILIILLLFLVIYLVYTVFQATSWYIATIIAGKEYSYKQYLLGFARLNILWMGGYLLYKILDVILGLRYIIIRQIVPGAPNIAGKVLLAAFVFFILAALFSYPLLKAKTIFKTPWRISLALVILCTSMFLAARFILDKTAYYGFMYYHTFTPAYVVGLLLLFPTITLIKVYATRVLSNVHARD